MITKSPASGARYRIRAAAVELMARKGVAGATTQDIAKRARCSQAAIYKYWESKEALAESLFREAHTRMIDAMRDGAAKETDPTESVLGALVGLLRFARSEPAEYAFLFQVFHSEYSRWLAGLPKPRDVVLDRILAAVTAGDLPEENTSLKAALLLGMAIRLAFFERQNLVGLRPNELDRGLVQAAAAVLEN